MKKKFIIFLCFSTLLYSCSPYTSFTLQEYAFQKFLPEENIIVYLVEGSVIRVQPYRHIYTTGTNNFIYGFGKRKHRYIPGEHIEFTGKLERASIDSLRIFGVGINRYLICYLPDSTDIYYWNGDYVIVTPDKAPGLWCAGILTTNQGDLIYSGRVLNKNIKSIEMKKPDEGKKIIAIMVVAGVVVIVLVAIAISSFNKNMRNFNL